MSDIAVVCKQSTRFVLGRIPQGTLVKNCKNCKKELGLGFENFIKPENIDMHSVTNDSVAMLVSIKAKFSNKINNDEFLDPLSTVKNLMVK